MGIFRRSAPDLDSLTSLEQYESLVDESHQRPVWILKHSTACGTSYRALSQFEKFAEQSAPDGDPAEDGEGSKVGPRFVVLDLRQHRSISNAIAERTGLRHQSPQALLFEGGEVVWSASHGSVTVAAMSEAKPGAALPPPPIFR